MKLIHKSTGQVVREGDKVTDFRGEKGIVLGWTKPQSPASTGRITVDVLGIEHYCYPEVYFCEWINREDRQKEQIEDFKPDWSSLETFPEALRPPTYDLSKLKPLKSPVRTADATTIEQIALMQKRIEELENTIRELQRILK